MGDDTIRRLVIVTTEHPHDEDSHNQVISVGCQPFPESDTLLPSDDNTFFRIRLITDDLDEVRMMLDSLGAPMSAKFAAMLEEYLADGPDDG